jgi:hypothetical protein
MPLTFVQPSTEIVSHRRYLPPFFRNLHDLVLSADGQVPYASFNEYPNVTEKWYSHLSFLAFALLRPPLHPDHKLYRVSTVLLLPLFSRKPLTSQPIVPQHETLKDYFLTLPAWPQASLPDYFA